MYIYYDLLEELDFWRTEEERADLDDGDTAAAADAGLELGRLLAGGLVRDIFLSWSILS